MISATLARVGRRTTFSLVLVVPNARFCPYTFRSNTVEFFTIRLFKKAGIWAHHFSTYMKAAASSALSRARGHP